MAVEDDILKTLVRIEKALGNGSVTSGLGRSSPSVAGGKKGNARQPIDRDEANRKKTFRATMAALQDITNSSATLNRSFTGLNKTVLQTRGNFVAMNRTMRAMPKSLTPPPAPAPVPIPQIPPAPREESSSSSKKKPKYNTDPWRVLPPFFRDFGTNLTETLREGFAARNSTTVTGTGRGSGRGNPPGSPPINPLDLGPQQPRRKLAGAITDITGKIRGAGAAVTSFTIALAGAVVPIARDVLLLHSAGIQASSALGGMYIDAARAGMSLQEYTKVIQSSSVAVTRSGSMAEFNAQLQVTNRRLEGLGIFGAEATKLSASLATSTTALGIPQSQLADATNAQIEVFERLRKTSLLTADEFQKLTEGLASNQTVQSQLLGMAPAQRAARMNELTQIKTIGLSLGSTKAASDALGDALIATRNLTAPKRFEAAGRIRQAGAMFGVDSSSTERLAQLSRKKIRTADEDREVVALAAPLQAAIQRAMQSGNISQENAAEQVSAALDSSGIGDVLKKAGNVALTTDSGQAGVNRNFAKGSSDLLIATGRLMAWMDGLEKNTIIKALGTGAIGALVGQILLRALPVLGIRGGGIRGAGAGGPPIPPAGGGAGGPGLLQRMFPTFTRLISGTYDLLKTGVSKIFSVFNPRNFGANISGFVSFIDKIYTHVSITFSNMATWMRGVSTSVTNVVGSIRGMVGNVIPTLGNAFTNITTWIKGIVPGIANAIGSVRGWFGNLIPNLKNIGTTVTGAVNSVGGVFGKIGSTVGGWMSSFRGAFGGLTNGLGGLIGGLLKRLPLIGALWDGIGELFSGTIMAAFNPSGDGGIAEVFGNMAFAIFNGFIGGIGKAVDWISSFFIKDGLHVENALNVLGVLLKTGLMKALSWATQWIPGAGNYFEKAATDSSTVLDKLLADNTLTVAKIGEQNKTEIDKKKATADASKAQADKTVEAQKTITAANAGILTSTKGITAGLVETARAAVATPVTPARQNVTPPTVNKPETATEATAKDTSQSAAAATATGSDLIIAQLTSINNVLASLLTTEQAAAAGISQIASASGRPIFANNEVKFDALQGVRFNG